MILQLWIVSVKSSSKIYNLSRFAVNKKGVELFQDRSDRIFRLHSVILVYTQYWKI